MKKSILSFLAFALLGSLYAQSQDAAVQQAVAETVSLYQLDRQQAAELQKIQERRFRNLAEIETLRDSDPTLYAQKKHSIREMTLATTRRLLHEAQLPVYYEQLSERRKQEAELKARLKTEGATPEEIQLAIWSLE
jgi:hypothetical protein